MLCNDAQLIEGEAETEGSVYRVSVSLGGLLRKTTPMQVQDLDESARSYRFVRIEPGNIFEMRFGVTPAVTSGVGSPVAVGVVPRAATGVAAGATAERSSSTIRFGARYEGSGRVLGVPVGGALFTRIIERAVDRSLPRLERLIRAEEG